MLTGFEALGAASAVLQVISFASDLAVACKNAYDGATTSQDDLQRYAGRMYEAVDCVHTRSEKMSNANSKFASPKLQTIAKECKDAAGKLEAEVQYVTSLEAKGDIVKSLRKAFRVSRHQKKLQALQESLSMYQQVIKTELVSHLCSQSDAIYFQQDASFGKLDTDIQFLINQLAQGITDVKDLVKREHDATRNAITQESARAEVAINSHTDSQVLKLRTTSETKRKCEVFLQSLKAPLMNQRYNEVMDSRDASFNQVFASHEDKSLVKHIHRSWASFNSWLQSNDKLFYIQGKPGSGKSTLVKFILDQDQTHNLVQRWSPDATILSYFFWKIGSEEQKSIKGLWCSLLYQRLQGRQQLILSILQCFTHLSRHSEYHDWAMKDLQTVWDYLANLDARHFCIFIDGLDEVWNEDGFSKLLESIDAISMFPEIKLCVSTRPEASITRWLKTKKAAGILLEDLTRYDMLVFVQTRFRDLSPNSQVSSESIQDLRHKLVDKAQGVFLWLHLATRSIMDGIGNMDSEDMLFARLEALPGDLENLYIDLWQRMNAKSPVYVETARRYFRYVLQHPGESITIFGGQFWYLCSQPWILQIACGENPEIREKLLKSTGTMELTEILRSGNLADCVLAAPQARDVLSRIDFPLVKIRYIQLPLTEKDTAESQRTFQRILSPQPLPIRDIEQLFDVDFEGLSQDLCVPQLKFEDRTDLHIITQYVKDKETEKVDVEDIMASLAAENLGFCTYEEAGITPPYEYLREAREKLSNSWALFPLAMGRLEAAAAIKEGVEGHE
ncbi:hypothetical protein ACKLNR_015007 [Fusarium oxysporum f. sp. zingiberi]